MGIEQKVWGILMAIEGFPEVISELHGVHRHH